MTDRSTTVASPDWAAWQASWDRQQGLYLVDREERFAAMLDGVEALAGRSPAVLDLACGPGSIASRLLRRFPDARIVGVDLDPALLAIARGVFRGDARATFVRADLADPSWTRALPDDAYDAVLTATALHWLSEARLAQLYVELAALVRPGGLFCNVDHMPPERGTEIIEAVQSLRNGRRERRRQEVPDWEEWWRQAAGDQRLADLVAERDRIFSTRWPDHESGDHPAALETFYPPASWHIARLGDAGFADAAVVWRGYDAAMVAALR